MIINHNINAINAYNRGNSIEKAKVNAMGKLSSGIRINTAADDSAGEAISQEMKTQIRGLQQCEKNIQDGISLINTADSGLASIMDPNLLRLRQLAVQAASSTLSDEDLKNIEQEVKEVLGNIDNIANNTEFNGIKLLNGTNPKSQIQTNIHEIPFDYKDVLKLPTKTGNGQLDLATNKGYPTTIEDDNKILDYGSGATSYPSVIVGGKNYYFQNQLSSNPSGTTVNILSNDLVGDKYITTYKIANATNNVDLEVTQSVGIVADKYEIRYDIKNNSPTTSQVGFQFNLDTDVANDDRAKFMVNGNVINQEKLYSTSTDVPDSFNVYNQSGSTNKIQACGILKTQTNPYNSSIKYEVLEEPSKFGIGQWSSHQIEKNNWTPPSNSDYGDSAYSVWYQEKNLANGETRSVNTFYGLSVPPTITKPDPEVIENPYDIILQVGANFGEQFRVELSDVRTEKLFQDGASLTTLDDAEKLIKYVDIAMQKVSDERTKYGAYQNALDHIANNVVNYGYNITSAESRLTDADMAKESMKVTKSQILEQASQAMLTQANKLPQQVLKIMAPDNAPM
jgi:Flagellin and related hook-associated proteins